MSKRSKRYFKYYCSSLFLSVAIWVFFPVSYISHRGNMRLGRHLFHALSNTPAYAA